MMRRRGMALLWLLLCLPRQVRAYESETTHPGLSSQAMLASRLHTFLRKDMGLGLGIFSRLALEPKAMDPREHRHLQLKLQRFDPLAGYRPDEKETQRAAGWLQAGSVLAGLPSSQEKNHFYCPSLRQGLSDDRPLLGSLVGLMTMLEGDDSVRQLLTGTGFDLTGLSALAWAKDKDNPLTAEAFYEHLAEAVTASTPTTRDHHLALALVAAGGLLHLLQDMASPTRVRNDFIVGHLQKLGNSAFDRGSVYERLVSVAYGQNGLPSYTGKPIARARILDFFSSPAWEGLADITSEENFSPGTIPASLTVLSGTDARELHDHLKEKLPLSRPSLGVIDLNCARRKTCYMMGEHGPLLAYRFGEKKNELRFFLDHECYSASARRLLPLAVGFSTGLLNHLLRGRLSLERSGETYLLKNLGAAGFSSARARLYVEDARGERRPLRDLALELPAHLGASLASFSFTPPPQARKIIVLLQGHDEHGDPLVATAQLPL